MNPWALLVILLGIVLVIIGVKGSQHEVVSTITGKKPASNSNGNSSGNSGGTSNGPTPVPSTGPGSAGNPIS